MGETIRVYGITFVRAPAHENRAGRWDMSDYHNGQVLSIRLDTRGKRTECTISVGAANDVARMRGFKLKLVGRSRRAVLIEALDIARYPLQLAGFGGLFT
jgi:hypothetical protein